MYAHRDMHLNSSTTSNHVQTKTTKPKKAAGAATAAKQKTKPVTAMPSTMAATGSQQMQLPLCMPAALTPTGTPSVQQLHAAQTPAATPQSVQPELPGSGSQPSSSGMGATNDGASMQKFASAQQCMGASKAQDRDVIMIDVEDEQTPQVDTGLSIAHLAAQAGKAASNVGR
jgi:hypothetical protein